MQLYSILFILHLWLQNYKYVSTSKAYFRSTNFRYTRFNYRQLQSRLFAQNKRNIHDYDVDVCVLGGGIGGSTISWLLQERENCTVALIDPKVDQPGVWYPNYGEWRDEWHALSDRLKLPELKACTTTEWEETDCFFGGSYDMAMEEKTVLDRPYVRVDRVQLQKLYRERFATASGLQIASKLSSQRIANNLFDRGLLHDASGSTLTLDSGATVRCKVIIDATGLESKLVGKETPMLARGSLLTIPIGFQIAYGFIATVNSMGPYNFSAMTLFDYRSIDTTDHLESDPAWLAAAEDMPTFMYVMPLSKKSDGSGYRVFWEETSLVGKDKRRLSFEECKKRALRRLEFHGIQYSDVEEEEYCYIPMGGELPDLTQRIVAFGGAANMVHPSTGYHACRMLAASSDVSSVIGRGVREAFPPDKIAAEAYKVYGGDFLMAQQVKILRGFFLAFFSINMSVWSGFLAGWPGLPGNIHHESWDRRLSFALQLFAKMPNEVRVAMILFSIRHTWIYGPNTLLRSLTPSITFGTGPEDYTWSPPPTMWGDEDAKAEARRMIKQFEVEKRSAASQQTVVEREDSSQPPFIVGTPEEEISLTAFPAPFN